MYLLCYKLVDMEMMRCCYYVSSKFTISLIFSENRYFHEDERTSKRFLHWSYIRYVPITMEVTANVILPGFDADPAKVVAALRATHVIAAFCLLHRSLDDG